MRALLLHALPWCIHWKWPYTSVNMSSHWWWHPKCLTSTPSSHSTNELLYGFCGDYPLSLTMSANDRAGTILKWFLPLQSATYMRGGGQMMGMGVRLHHPLAGWLFIYFSLRFTPLVLKRHSEQERSLHSRSHHKVDWTCRCRCLGLSFKTWASLSSPNPQITLPPPPPPGTNKHTSW